MEKDEKNKKSLIVVLILILLCVVLVGLSLFLFRDRFVDTDEVSPEKPGKSKPSTFVRSISNI